MKMRMICWMLISVCFAGFACSSNSDDEGDVHPGGQDASGGSSEQETTAALEKSAQALCDKLFDLCDGVSPDAESFSSKEECIGTLVSDEALASKQCRNTFNAMMICSIDQWIQSLKSCADYDNIIVDSNVDQKCSAEIDAWDSCEEGGGSCADDAGCTDDDASTTTGTLSLQASFVGAWQTVSHGCASGSPNYAVFMCPGGRFRGAGEATSDGSRFTELMCGTYTTNGPSYPDCTDLLGCFPSADASFKSTIILGGGSDIANESRTLWLSDQNHVIMYGSCNDGSRTQMVMARALGEVGDTDCYSDACPAPSGTTTGAYGSCGTDCDCGHCWYCESGQCRFGGEGPYGCYRGCSW